MIFISSGSPIEITLDISVMGFGAINERGMVRELYMFIAFQLFVMLTKI